MIEEIQRLLPAIKLGNISETDIQNLTARIRGRIKEYPSEGRELGKFLSQIKQATRNKPFYAPLNWVPVDTGFLAIGHKPGGKISFEDLKNQDTSTILTLLNENEGASAIGRRSQAMNIDWIWFPFSASEPHSGADTVHIYQLYKQLAGLINTGNKIYIHCSAGIHRTGMITYGFLRFLGKEKTDAFMVLQSLREITATQVGEARLLWADQFGLQQSER